MLTVQPNTEVAKPTIQAFTSGLRIATPGNRLGIGYKMSWKIEKYCDGLRTTIRLIGRMQVQHLQDLQMLIDESGPTIALDLEELMLVDLEAVRFLARCQNNGASVLHCSQYIRDWIAKERDKGK